MTTALRQRYHVVTLIPQVLITCPAIASIIQWACSVKCSRDPSRPKITVRMIWANFCNQYFLRISSSTLGDNALQMPWSIWESQQSPKRLHDTPKLGGLWYRTHRNKTVFYEHKLFIGVDQIKNRVNIVFIKCYKHVAYVEWIGT